MKSSMGITKIAAVRFMFVLHLFLNVKMCVGFVGDAVAAASDSDINYDDDNSGEWPGGGARGPPHPPPPPTSSFSSSGSVPAPDNLVRWKDLPHHHHHHGHARSRMHHVRHEQHYVQGRPAKGATRHPISAPDESSLPVDAFRTTVHGPQQKSRHSHHNHRKHHKHHPKPSSLESSEEAGADTKREVVHRFEVLDLGATKEAHRGSRGSVSPVANNRKRSTSTFHSAMSHPPPAGNSLWLADEPARPSGTKTSGTGKTTRATQYTLRSANPHSKNYFEELLNNYKSHSPLYKDHQPPPQTKALAQGHSRDKPRAKSGSGTGLVAKAKAKTSDTAEYDYSYEDEQDDAGVQNDGTFGEPAPATTSTTTKMPSTTQAQEARGFAEEDSSGAGEPGDGDSGYSAFYQKAYTMQKNPRRSGNNLYNSLAPRATVGNHQYASPRTHGNPVDPARQVSVPKQYSSMTEMKQVNFGTKDAVDRIYSQYSGRTKDYIGHQAQLHFERIKVEGLCKVPRPKLVPASTNRSLDFRPHRTILHRCDDETGCCMPSETCVPKHTATVDLYFYVAPVRGRSHYQARALTFVNHTECHCVQRSSTSSSSGQAASSLPASGEVPPKPPTVVCRCPKHFKSIVDSESECYCDCLADNRDCIRFKEGLESFSMDDRRCILKRSCFAPLCKHGTFDRIAGKCPKKTDRMDQLFSSAVYR